MLYQFLREIGRAFVCLKDFLTEWSSGPTRSNSEGRRSFRQAMAKRERGGPHPIVVRYAG